MRKRNIIHLVNNFADSSITRIIYQIIRTSDPAEYSWYVGSFGEPDGMEKMLTELGVRCIKYNKSSLNDQIRTDIERNGMAVIHSHTPRTALTAWQVLRSIPFTRRPIHINTKHLLTHPTDRRWGLFYSMIDWYSLYLPDRVVPVSLTMSKLLKRITIGLNAKIIPIPNGIDIDMFTDKSARQVVRDEFLFPKNAFVFGYTGRMEQVKRLDLLLIAFQAILNQFPSARLLLIGDGKMRSRWMDLARELQVEKGVIWAGFRQDIPRMMAVMDAYVQPSDNEGLSLSILEAMAARIPVIATRVGAAQEVITHRITGWLVDRGSSPQLVEGMKTVIENPILCSAMTDAAYKVVCSGYSIEKMTGAYHTLYRTLKRGVHHD